MKVKSGDIVTVIAGNDRGKTGQVLRVERQKGRVVVEGINIRAKHVKGENGGIIRSEASIDVSNVKLGESTTKKTAKPRSTNSGQAATKIIPKPTVIVI